MATNVIAIKTSAERNAKPTQPESAPARSTAQADAAGSVGILREGLPFIGHYPVARQQQILLGLAIFFVLVAGLFVLINTRQAAQSALQLATATEMQMLSQRIANSAQQAVQGAAPAFADLKRGHDQFVEDLQLLGKGGTKLGVSAGPSADSVQPALAALDKLWVPVQKNIALILAQEKNLIELKQRETTIEKLAPQLSLQASELMISSRDAEEGYGVV